MMKRYGSGYVGLHNDAKLNTAEIMIQPETDKNIFNEVIEFAKAIRMVPLPLYKE